jgi:hypothetical protein
MELGGVFQMNVPFHYEKFVSKDNAQVLFPF